MKLAPRLQQIDQLVNRHYSSIWDCCCDHGLLGMQLLKRDVADRVHFVDVAESITDVLLSKLATLTEQGSLPKHWQVHCQDVAQLVLPEAAEEADAPHLVIIAGVGGDLLVELVRGIVEINLGKAVEFILCPVYHVYYVRQSLREMGFGLLKETLVTDNKRGYEILHVSLTAETVLTAVGAMWDLTDNEHCAYLQQLLSHYQRIARNPQQSVDPIIQQYQQLLT